MSFLVVFFVAGLALSSSDVFSLVRGLDLDLEVGSSCLEGLEMGSLREEDALARVAFGMVVMLSQWYEEGRRWWYGGVM